ncbi:MULTISPECIES: helix-turn-helix transcriptional regulator [Clostridia]|uniref:helix-turn-helix domain-containing protein n=1 Tax=Clostridia TaxID=186801 RepID=UPI002900AB40|nr:MULTISPECIES: helix-turn-helix transcriptional regulator [Clostridia]MDU1175662.1 helix-turn-helix transcriptional regulator [Peptostreptococcus anaerobius]MDU1232123.1 helix-turn-helix transcriptional regulator [Clostridium sp.]MDU1233579.1 helix-turn-helix transcriptional regulator [Peptostreptococcus anaerobius]
MKNVTFGGRLRTLREELNLTQTELAKKFNMSPPSISQYEKDIRSPDFTLLLKLADFFDVSTDYLLGRTNLRNYPETFAAHTDDDMSDEAKAELENFKEFLKMKYGK